ncbi:MAG TPA: hypothetical protein VHF58_03110 [Solirubrobacterales bacterium]|nr:hypothetical protein [Solirubrobacterales bacterium]
MGLNHEEQLQKSAAVTIRRVSEDGSDRAALIELAERDSGEALDGELLVAEIEGRILAAISLEDDRVVADPFSRTGELRKLLELRRAQLRRRSRPGRLPALIRRGRPRAVLAGSPPGAGGRLLQLDSSH